MKPYDPSLGFLYYNSNTRCVIINGSIDGYIYRVSKSKWAPIIEIERIINIYYSEKSKVRLEYYYLHLQLTVHLWLFLTVFIFPANTFTVFNCIYVDAMTQAYNAAKPSRKITVSRSELHSTFSAPKRPLSIFRKPLFAIKSSDRHRRTRNPKRYLESFDKSTSIDFDWQNTESQTELPTNDIDARRPHHSRRRWRTDGIISNRNRCTRRNRH